MRQLMTIIICLLMLFPIGIPVLAVSEDASGGDDVSNQPVETNYEVKGGIPYITRIYHLERRVGATSLTEEFTQDGYLFKKYDVTEKKLPVEKESREETRTETTETDSNDTAALIASLSREIEYSEDGYEGVLELDEGSIQFSEAAYASYTYPVSEIREYPNLPGKQSSYVDKTIVVNGVFLHLTGIVWEMGNGMAPNLYKATAYYAGTGEASYVTGYTASYTYRGTVMKETDAGLQYAITFRGEPEQKDGAVSSGVETAPSSESETPSSDGNAGPNYALFIVGGLLLFGVFGGGWVLKRRRSGRVEKEKHDFWDDDEPAVFAPDATEPHSEQPADTYPSDDFGGDDYE